MDVRPEGPWPLGVPLGGLWGPFSPGYGPSGAPGPPWALGPYPPFPGWALSGPEGILPEPEANHLLDLIGRDDVHPAFHHQCIVVKASFCFLYDPSHNPPTARGSGPR